MGKHLDYAEDLIDRLALKVVMLEPDDIKACSEVLNHLDEIICSAVESDCGRDDSDVLKKRGKRRKGFITNADKSKEMEPKETEPMDVKFVNPFISATINVLTTMASMEPKAGKPYLKSGKRSTGDVMGLIGLAGVDKKGSFAVSFKESCIKKIVSKNPIVVVPFETDAGEFFVEACLG